MASSSGRTSSTRGGGKVDIYVKDKLTACFNGLIIGEVADKFIPPKQIKDSRFYAYTAADKTYRVCRVGKPFKVAPATPAMF